MKRHIVTLLLLLLACGAWAQDTFYYKGGKKYPLSVSKVRNAVETYKSPNGDYMEASGYLYVKLKSLNDKEVLERTAKSYGLIVIEQNKFMPLWFVLKKENSTRGKSLDIANSLYETGLFEECAPDLSFDGREISYDPFAKEQWNLYNDRDDKYSKKGVDINISDAWNYATGKGVVIAIVDNGVELTHKDLATNIYHKSYDARSGTSPSKVYLGTGMDYHATHCAGIAAAVRNNGFGIAGVAPDAKIMSVSEDFGANSLRDYNLANGIMWAWKNGADIISCSWGLFDASDLVTAAIDSALTKGRDGKGCIVVKSAGNNGKDITFPGNVYGVITVANIAPDGGWYYTSSHGDNLFVSAPGTNIPSTVLNDSIESHMGTSMAAPHVSGVAALMLERNPDLTVWQVREIIARTARRLDTMPSGIRKAWGQWDEYYGYGLLNARDAVLMSIEYNNGKE